MFRYKHPVTSFDICTIKPKFKLGCERLSRSVLRQLVLHESQRLQKVCFSHAKTSLVAFMVLVRITVSPGLDGDIGHNAKQGDT